MYLTYAEYQEYGGTLDEATFNDFEMEAETIVDWYTFNRLQQDSIYPDRLKMCMYQLINLAQQKKAAMAQGESADGATNAESAATIASRSNDGVSISYNVMSANELFTTLKDEFANVVRRYLDGVVNQLGRKVLYRGIYAGE